MATNPDNPAPLNPGPPDNPVVSYSSARTASGINVLAGIWLIISPFVLGFWRVPAATWDNIIVGIVVLILAATRVAGPARTAWASWVNLILGIWLIISPWVLRIAEYPSPTWNNVILGIIVGILGIASALTTPYSARMTR